MRKKAEIPKEFQEFREQFARFAHLINRGRGLFAGKTLISGLSGLPVQDL